LKKLIALATVESGDAAPGTALEMELTVEAVPSSPATVVDSFFNPPRKTKTPIA
jgi:hypothetical protein